jgi:hypothetical protein
MNARLWGWTLFTLVGLGAIGIGAAFATGYQSLSGFLWELPLLAMATAICAAGALGLGFQRSTHHKFSALAVALAMALWILFSLAFFDITLTGPFDRLYDHALNALMALLIILGMWSAAALPLLAIEAQTRLMRILRRTSLATCTLLAVVWIGYYVQDNYISSAESFTRAALVIATVAAMTSVLCLPAGLLLSRKRDAQTHPIEIACVLCPRCGTSCDAHDLDRVACAQCQLSIELDRREPRCRCGYLLVNLNGSTCPECGRQFAARLRFEMVEV